MFSNPKKERQRAQDADHELDAMYDMAMNHPDFIGVSRYADWMCATATEVMEAGGSLVQVAAKIGVASKTVYTWIDENHPSYIPEFADAVELGRDKAQAWWESQVQRGIWAGKAFNSTAYIFIMKTRFKHHYGDKPTASVDGDGNADATIDALNASAKEAFDDWTDDDEKQSDPA